MTAQARRLAPFVLLLALAVLGGFGAGASFAEDEPKKITGKWMITGWNPGADTTGAAHYKGTVEVAQKGEKGCYTVLWKIGKAVQPGIGVYDAKTGVLATAYVASNGKPTVVLYRPDESGEKLLGFWTMGGVLTKPAGRENWSR
jgi:hypothetical protein